jgi:hypothetical protein
MKQYSPPTRDHESWKTLESLSNWPHLYLVSTGSSIEANSVLRTFQIRSKYVPIKHRFWLRNVMEVIDSARAATWESASFATMRSSVRSRLAPPKNQQLTTLRTTIAFNRYKSAFQLTATSLSGLALPSPLRSPSSCRVSGDPAVWDCLNF